MKELTGKMRQPRKAKPLGLALASFDEKKALNDAADRIAELEKALREIAELDYANAATNGAAYDAVRIAKSVL